jgi:hypothetical protein
MSTIRVEAIPTRPLSTLSPSSPVMSTSQPAEVFIKETVTLKSMDSSVSWLGWILCLILLGIIFSLLLYVFNPTTVQNKDSNGNPTGTPNWGTVIFYAIFFAVLLMILAYCFKAKC